MKTFSGKTCLLFLLILLLLLSSSVSFLVSFQSSGARPTFMIITRNKIINHLEHNIYYYNLALRVTDHPPLTWTGDMGGLIQISTDRNTVNYINYIYLFIWRLRHQSTAAAGKTIYYISLFIVSHITQELILTW